MQRQMQIQFLSQANFCCFWQIQMWSLAVSMLWCSVCRRSNCADGRIRVIQGWPFTLRGGCGAELWKSPQWFLPLRWLATFISLEKRDAEIGHLPGGFKCEFGGGSRVQKKSISMRKLNLRELNAENCVN